MIDDILRGRSSRGALDFLFLVLIVGRVTVFVNERKTAGSQNLLPALCISLPYLCPM